MSKISKIRIGNFLIFGGAQKYEHNSIVYVEEVEQKISKKSTSCLKYFMGGFLLLLLRKMKETTFSIFQYYFS